ncbi:MAG: hypothetical protein GY847_38995 [Proteobacteria bacterium]|nr:hypothetical protein [Pseudomonadota bacterium]
MRIGIVATELSPFIESTLKSADIASLASAFTSLGHDVFAIIPMTANIDVNAHSLARRLTPISFEMNDQSIRCARYDGRTPSGINVHLLEVEGFPYDTTTQSTEAFCRAAACFLCSLSDPFDWCFSWDEETSLLPSLFRELAPASSKTAHMLIVSSLEDSSTTMTKGFAAADCAIIYGRDCETGAISKANKPLADMISQGRAVTVSRPGPTGKPLTLNEKASAKATFQMQSHLPVRDDVPLVLFTETNDKTFPDTLKSFLTEDVQAVCRRTGTTLTSLAERYPDRLAIVPETEAWEKMLEPVDACLAVDDVHLALQALSNSTVPITDLSSAAGIVDLEPTRDSGSGILVESRSTQSMVTGLKRFVSAYRTGSAFKALAARLPGYVTTWPTAARQYLDLMAEVK